MSESVEHRCATCGVSGIKLYRPYGEFFRPGRVQCQEHVPAAEVDWYVPMIIEPESGEVWGYTSGPPEDIARWEALPASGRSRGDAGSADRTRLHAAAAELISATAASVACISHLETCPRCARPDEPCDDYFSLAAEYDRLRSIALATVKVAEGGAE